MLLINANLATLDGSDAYGLIQDGAIWIRDGRILWAGYHDRMPDEARDQEALDLDGRLVTPGLVDCHTHIVHAGDRASEFESRQQGATYEEIAKAGGGIISTMRDTRRASSDELLASALSRVDESLAGGVTTLEIKSGYGLDIDTELKMLRVAREIARQRPVRIKATFLGAHAVPAEYAGKADMYLQDVCLPALEQAHAEGLVDAVDGFCENIAFSADQIRTVFEKASQLNLPVKLHAEQLSRIGGTQAAAAYRALSCDHLEYSSKSDVDAMAQAGTVAVLLPGAFYFLRETKLPPIALFRNRGVDMALATDCNPGSSPLTSMLLCMNMACTIFGLTPEEALAGATMNGAKALGLDNVGRIRAGNYADLAVWDVGHPAKLSYLIGSTPLHMRIFEGEIA